MDIMNNNPFTVTQMIWSIWKGNFYKNLNFYSIYKDKFEFVVILRTIFH